MRLYRAQGCRYQSKGRRPQLNLAWLDEVRLKVGNDFPALSQEALVASRHASLTGSGTMSAQFDEIFDDRKQANEGFDLFAAWLSAFGIEKNTIDDPRLAFTMPQIFGTPWPKLRLNVGNWIAMIWCGPNIGERVQFAGAKNG